MVGWKEKGDTFARNHMVPVPQVASWEALNLFLLEASQIDEQRLPTARMPDFC